MLEDWKKSTVGESCTIRNDLRFPINTEARSIRQGEYPYFGPTGILDYIDHYRIDGEFSLIGEDGDHFLKFREKEMTVLFKGKANVNNHAHVIFDSKKCTAKWFHYFFMYKDLKAHLSRQGVQRYKLTKKGLESLEILLPPKDEQEQITSLLSTWDKAILITKKLIEDSQKKKDILSHQLLSGYRRRQVFQRSPERALSRFGSAPRDWLMVKIEDIAEHVSMKNTLNQKLQVLSCTKYDGLVDSLSYFKKRIFSENTSTYKVVERGMFAYATNHIEEGSIGYQNLCDVGLISPMYTVFRISNAIHHGFLYKLLKTEHYRQIFAASTNASVDRRGSLRWPDFKKILVPLPPYDEQVWISSVIDIADQELRTLEANQVNLRQQKNALMQQLLTGKRRVQVDLSANAAA